MKKEKIVPWFRKNLLSPLVFFLALLALDWGFRRIYSFAGQPGMGRRLWILLFTVGWAGFFTSLTMALPDLLRRILTILIGLVFVVLALVHGVLYGIFGHFFSFADMNFAGDGFAFFSWSYLNLRLVFLAGLVLVLLGVILSVVLLPRQKWHPWQLGALVLAVLCLLPVKFAHDSLTPEKRAMTWDVFYQPNDPKPVYYAFNDPNKCLNLVGLYQYTARDLYRTLGFEDNTKSWEELDAFFDQRAGEISGDTDMTGIFKDRNFLMIMLESMDTWLLTPEIMPNLYAVQAESIDLVNHYTPLFLTAGTFNTEFTSLTGLIPSAMQESSAFPGNAFPLSLPHLFANEGCTVNSFHSAGGQIYSRAAIHQNLGFEKYHSYVEMGMDDYQLDSQMIRGFDLMTQGDRFFSYLITYSGHGPYTEQLANISDPHLDAARAVVSASGITDTAENLEEYTLAVAHAMETDAFIGELMEALRESGHDQDTVLLFYTDHYGKYMTDKEFLNRLKGVSSGSPELYRTPCFFWAADQEPRTVTKYTATVDLLPTIVKLFDLDADLRYFVGDDVFGDRGGFVCLPYYGYTGPDGQDLTSEVKRRVDASNDTLSSNYFVSWNNH